jgi:hypothetical protein
MQGVLVFADATARDAAITAPVHGQVAFLKDTNETVFYDSARSGFLCRLVLRSSIWLWLVVVVVGAANALTRLLVARWCWWRLSVQRCW